MSTFQGRVTRTNAGRSTLTASSVTALTRFQAQPQSRLDRVLSSSHGRSFSGQIAEAKTA